MHSCTYRHHIFEFIWLEKSCLQKLRFSTNFSVIIEWKPLVSDLYIFVKRRKSSLEWLHEDFVSNIRTHLICCSFNYEEATKKCFENMCILFFSINALIIQKQNTVCWKENLFELWNVIIIIKKGKPHRIIHFLSNKFDEN